MEIRSKRLIIRDSVFADCDLFYQWEIQDYIRKCFSISKGETKEEIFKRFILRSEDPTMRQYTIVLAENGLPIGRVYLTRYDESLRNVDINRIYIGREEYLRKGLGEEALRLLLNYFFVELQMERVELNHYPDNKRAAALYKKVGFQYEGFLRQFTIRDGKYYGLYQLSMLRAEYLEGITRPEDDLVGAITKLVREQLGIE